MGVGGRDCSVLLCGEIMQGLKKLDLAWAAGFFDGEGSVVVWHKPAVKVCAGKVYNLRVSVGCTDLEPIEKLKYLFGGKIYYRKPLRANWKGCHIWHLSSKQAKGFLGLVLPFLVVKGKQAELGIRLQNHISQTYGAKDGNPKAGSVSI